MHPLSALPTSLLLLIASSSCLSLSQAQQWPYNLPPDARYSPEEETFIRRDLEIGQKLLQQPVAGVRKMSGDEGEKFFMEYWQFQLESHHPTLNNTEEAVQPAKLRLRPDVGEEDEGSREWLNSSIPRPPQPPFGAHFDEDPASGLHLLGRRFRLPRSLKPRGFQCPAGTSACASISRPNSCCATDETCELVTPGPLGDVGCCAAGQTCLGELSRGCDSSLGLTACPNNPGGGCCIPGYQCLDVGCVYISTATVIVMPTTSTIFSSPSTVIATTITSTAIVPAGFPTTTTRIITPSTSSSSSSSTPTSSTLTPTTSTSTRTILGTTSSSSFTPSPSTCTSGFQSCPASLGGGCCPTDRICASNRLCVTSISRPAPNVPFRPTSDSGPTTTATAISDLTIPGAICPTGFYACSAFYRGGCCRTGRDCDTTSCPPTNTATVIDTRSITVLAPSGSGVSGYAGVPNGNCATGWSTCGSAVGGGCCPSGFGCGQLACTATASGGARATVGKIAPSAGVGTAVGRWKALITGLVAVGVGILIC